MAINFKEQLDADIGDVFLNPNEFADPHYIEGELITCVVDSDEFRERVAKSAANFAEGVFLQGVVVFLKRDDLEADPVIGQRITLDDDYYYILNVEDESGMMVLTLGANQS